MVKQGFHIGSRDWWVMAYYDVREQNLNEVREVLLAGGCPMENVEAACNNLAGLNAGYTFTNYDERLSVMLMGRATSAEQMFDSIVHELKHLVEHVSDYYGLDPKEELSAYLQGEVGRKMFPAASMVICPRCCDVEGHTFHR